MNRTDIDLITLRMTIRSIRNNMSELHKVYRSDNKGIKGQEFERYARLMEKYQSIHIQKTGEIYC